MFRTPVSKAFANPQPPGTDCCPSTEHAKHKPDVNNTKKLSPGKAIFGRALFQPLAVLTRTPLARTQTAGALAESCHPIAMRNLTCPAPRASDGMAQQLGQQALKQGPSRTRRRPGFAGNKSLNVTVWHDQQVQRATNNSWAILAQPECMCCKAGGTAIWYRPHAFIDARRGRSTARGDHRAPRKASAATFRNRHDATLARCHLLPKRLQRHRQCTWQKQRKATRPSKHIGASVQSLSENRWTSPRSSSVSGGVCGA